MPDRERKRVPDHRSNVLKGSFPQGPSDQPRNMEIEYSRLSEESEKDITDEATQRGKEELYERQCTCRCIESRC